MAYGLSNGHGTDDVMWPQRCCEAIRLRSAILATAWLLVRVYFNAVLLESNLPVCESVRPTSEPCKDRQYRPHHRLADQLVRNSSLAFADRIPWTRRPPLFYAYNSPPRRSLRQPWAALAGEAGAAAPRAIDPTLSCLPHVHTVAYRLPRGLWG